MDTSSPARPRALPAPPASEAQQPAVTGLGAEVRESVVLLAVALGVTVGLTAVAQAALSALA
jgi:hypothetical protein